MQALCLIAERDGASIADVAARGRDDLIMRLAWREFSKEVERGNE